MKLTVYFYGKDGTSLQAPTTIIRGDVEEMEVYAEALRLRDALVAKRGVRVFLHTEAS